VLLELNCETDFVAKNDQFRRWRRIYAANRRRQPAVCGARTGARRAGREGKGNRRRAGGGQAAGAIEKIVQGKLDKWYGTVCLLEQPFVRDQNKTVKDYLTDAIAAPAKTSWCAASPVTPSAIERPAGSLSAC